MADAHPDSPRWYRPGLQFACTQCGNCCTGAPGRVRVNASEIAALADRLGMSEGKFRAVYTRRIGDSDVSLKEKSNHECIFYKEDKGCTIYQHRPRQCRTWPFWQSVVATPATWAQEALECPGMNHGPTHLSEHVYELSQHDGTFGNPPADE